MSTPDEGWADFTHTTLTPKLSAHELFERYREFQAFIAGLSRKELVARRWLKTADDDSPLETIFFDLPLSNSPDCSASPPRPTTTFYRSGRFGLEPRPNTVASPRSDRRLPA